MPFLIFRKAAQFACLLVVAGACVACGNRAPEVSIAEITPTAHTVNVNTASLDELTRIPHVGEKVAAKIIEYREEHGPFRRIEHLMLIQGISDARFRKIRPLVRVE